MSVVLDATLSIVAGGTAMNELTDPKVTRCDNCDKIIEEYKDFCSQYCERYYALWLLYIDHE